MHSQTQIFIQCTMLQTALICVIRASFRDPQAPPGARTVLVAPLNFRTGSHFKEVSSVRPMMCIIKTEFIQGS